MPIDVRFEGEILRITFSGALSQEDLSELTQSVMALEQQSAVIPHRITDMRPATGMNIDFHSVYELARLRRATRFPNTFKSALIASDLVHVGFARMFQTLNDHPSIFIEIFPDEPQALAWIHTPGFDPPLLSPS